MEYITWTSELNVGVEKFNDEHKKLVDYINRLHMGIVSGDSKSALESILSGLIEYTAGHFSHEEDLMIRHSYANYEIHRQEHENLKAKVIDFDQRLKEGKLAFSIELMKFLRDWLTNHINISDKAYSKFFNEKGVV